MSKRILATLCVTIFVLATLATVNQVSAHYTLGNQNWRTGAVTGKIGETDVANGAFSGGMEFANGGKGDFPRFHLAAPADGTFGHKAGHIAFVQPGSLYVPTSDQVNYYSPNGAVITESVGDLTFYVCVSDDLKDGQTGPINISWRPATPTDYPSTYTTDPGQLPRYFYVAIPPEFVPPVNWARGSADLLTVNRGDGVRTNVATSITNDYNMIYTGKFQENHPVAPGWWFIRITATPILHPASTASPAYRVEERNHLTKMNSAFDFEYVDDANYGGSAGFLYPPNMDPWLDRQMRTGDFKGCYKIAASGMKAPSIAGKYFFKMFYTSTYQPMQNLGIVQTAPGVSHPVYGTEGGWPNEWQASSSVAAFGDQTYPWSGYLNNYFEKYDSFWPENYPVLLVKGEVDPGFINGVVRYCGHSSYYYGYYYGAGVHTSGKVIAEGTAIDPVTGASTGRKVTGMGYFLGQLPGQGEDWKDRQMGSEGYYELEGLAPGIYTLTAYAAGFVPRVLATSITVLRGQSIHGVDIYICPTAKLQTQVYSKCPTGPLDWPTYVTLDTYAADHVILPVVPGGADVRGSSSTGPAGSPVAPDGIWYWFTEGAQTVQAKNLWAELMSTRATTGPVNPGELAAFLAGPRTPTENKYGWAWQELIDSNGAVAAYQDFTFDISESGDKRSFGTFWGDPSCYSGIETMWDGHVPTFLADFTSGIVPGTYRVRTWVYGYVQTKEYTVSFPAVEFPGKVYMEMDLFKGGTIDAIVHFHDQELPSAVVAPAANKHVLMEATDANGIQGWAASWTDGKPELTIRIVGEPNAWAERGRIHGMPEGTYTIKAYTGDYVQQEFPQHTIQYCTTGSLSFHLIKGAFIKTTVYSRDCQDPSQPVKWVHPGEAISIVLVTPEKNYGSRKRTFQDPEKSDTGSQTVSGSGSSLIAYLRTKGKPYGLPTAVYEIYVYTPGYIQLQVPKVWAQKGTSTGDIPVYLLVGPEIRVVIDFKTELIPAPLPDTDYSFYFRIHAFDVNGTLVAANITAVPQATWTIYSQWPWAGTLNPSQPDGVETWVFQLFGFSPFTTPTNTPAWGRWQDLTSSGPNWGATFGTVDPYYLEGYHDGDKFYRNYGIMWGKTYTITVTAPNYIQLATVTATPTCKGITTVVFEMDKLGKIAGFVYARNFMGDFTKASWYSTTAKGATATKTLNVADGSFSSTGFPPDTWIVTASSPGYKTGTRSVVTTWGGVTGGQDFYLEESGIPIPEFPAAGLLAFVSALAASLYLLKSRKQIPALVR